MPRPLLLQVMGLGAAAWLALAPAATAQGRGAGGQRPEVIRRQMDSRQMQLRQMIEERFATQVQTELGLSDEQMVQVRQILNRSAERLRQVEAQDRAVQQGLRDQLRPGVAAETDSVVRLLDRLTTLRVRVAELAREELRELAVVLTPVQQAQYVLLRDRLRMRAQEVRMQRGMLSSPPLSEGGEG